MIPKIIHYCWFGKGNMPSEFVEFIEGWKNILPDYQIIRWDESNAPLHLGYVSNALVHKNWANVSNYVRLHALYEFGGIYLDTDIELLKSFDELLSDSVFVGFQNKDVASKNCVNNAVLGAEKGSDFIKELMDEIIANYDGNEPAAFSSPNVTTSVLKNRGLSHYGNQKLGHISIYEEDFFYPLSYLDQFKNPNFERDKKNKKYVTHNTFCIHYWDNSWKKPVKQSLSKKITKSIKRLLIK